MLTNTFKNIGGLILILTTNNLTLGLDTPEECPYTEEDGPKDFYFNNFVNIEGLRYDEVCTRHRASNLADALQIYHNEAINCACPMNSVRYTDVIISSTEIISGDDNDVEWCEERNQGSRRGLTEEEEEDDDEFSDRSLFEGYVTRVGYSATGFCGNYCPTNPFPGSSCIDCGPGFGFLAGSSGFRKLVMNEDDSQCYGPLFVQVLNENGFEGVTGIASASYEEVSREETPFPPSRPQRPTTKSGKKGISKKPKKVKPGKRKGRRGKKGKSMKGGE